MKLLFITPFLRVPADFGIGVRNFQILKHLTERHDVTVITYGADETGQTDEWLRARGAEVVRLPYSLPWTSGTGRLTALRNLFYYPPAPFQRFSGAALADAIESCLAKTPDIDLILFDTHLTGHAVLKRNFTKPHAVIIHDIYGESLRKQYHVTSWRPHKIVRLVDWLKTSYYERRVLSGHRNLIAVSRADQAYLEQSFPGANIIFSSNGVDTEEFSRNGYKDDGKTLLFVGAFEYEPNVDAFFYFCREILPLVRAERPDVKFVAVGRNPTAAMREYAATNPRIEVTGTVNDVRPYYGAASVVVLPLRFGSGMKLKTLEAFAMGVPVVTTSVGVEGIEVESAVDCAVADSAEGFAKATLAQLANSTGEMASNARQLVEENYSWPVLMDRFDAELSKVFRAGDGLGDAGNRPLHIAFVIAPGGGPEANVKTLAPELETRGDRVSVIYTASPDKVDTSWSKSVRFRFAPVASLHYYAARLVGSFHAWALRIRAWEQSRAVRNALKTIEREEHIDVVEVTEGFSATNLGKAWPIVIRAHGSDWTFRQFCEDGNSENDRWLIADEAREIQHVKGVSALSDQLAQHLRDALKLSAPIDVVPYGIDTNAFSPNGNNSTSSPVLLTVGRLEHRKGVDVLLCAMPKVWGRFPDAQVRLIGSEADLTREDLRAMVPADKRKQIVFPGFLNRAELVKEYQHATLYVAPTQYETFGYTVLEAMSCGRPVISTRVGAIAELIEDGTNGLLVQWNDADGLADSIIRLLSDPSFAARLGAAGRQRAIEKFSLDRVVQRNLDYYQRAINQCTS